MAYLIFLWYEIITIITNYEKIHEIKFQKKIWKSKNDYKNDDLRDKIRILRFSESINLNSIGFIWFYPNVLIEI